MNIAVLVTTPRPSQPTVDWTPTTSGTESRPQPTPSTRLVARTATIDGSSGSRTKASVATVAIAAPIIALCRKPTRR